MYPLIRCMIDIYIYILDIGSTLNQRWANASRSLEGYWTYSCITSDEPMSYISTCDILFSFLTRCQLEIILLTSYKHINYNLN